MNPITTKIPLKQSKDNHYKVQFEKTYTGFYTTPQTMKELSVKTNIDRANICRYCRTLRLQKRLYLVGKKYCSITKHLANIYTTNEKYRPNTGQLELFTN